MGIFDQIKAAFSKSDDEPVKEDVTAAPAAEPGSEPEAPAGDEAGTYTVKSGDTLFKIAEEVLGDGKKYTEIFEANREVLDSPDHILPGQKLIIP